MPGMNRLARLSLLALLAAGIGAAWHWRGALDPVAVTELVAASPVAPVVFIALHIAASLFFVPRTLLAVGAGIVFGMWWGVVWLSRRGKRPNLIEEAAPADDASVRARRITDMPAEPVP